jgi:hypothetical protein
LGRNLEKSESRAGSSLNAIDIDPEKVDIELIQQNLEANPNDVLSLYNYLLEKRVIDVA